jgi:hypothetical protein
MYAYSFFSAVPRADNTTTAKIDNPAHSDQASPIALYKPKLLFAAARTGGAKWTGISEKIVRKEPASLLWKHGIRLMWENMSKFR